MMHAQPIKSNSEVLRILLDILSTEVVPPEEIANRLFEGSYSISFCNPYSVHVAKKCPDYLGLLEQFSSIHADGFLLSKVASALLEREVPRLSFDGNSIASHFWKRASEINAKIALVGGRPGAAKRASSILQRLGISVTYCSSGFFENEIAREQSINDTLESDADVILVGMGAPFQERFSVDIMSSGFSGCLATCGGYIEQLAKAKAISHYPNWVNNSNLRFAHRIMCEPSKMIGRYLIGYLPFYKAAYLLLSSKDTAISRQDGSVH